MTRVPKARATPRNLVPVRADGGELATESVPAVPIVSRRALISPNRRNSGSHAAQPSVPAVSETARNASSASYG